MTEFERFACYDRNIGTATLSRYGTVLSNQPTYKSMISDEKKKSIATCLV